VGHAHPPLGTLLDQGELFQQGRVAGMAQAHQLEEAGIDFIDDLQLSGQQLFEQFQIPCLQCFWQEGVVGVADRGRGDGPGRIPVQAVFIDQQPHQLRHCDRGVGVV